MPTARASARDRSLATPTPRCSARIPQKCCALSTGIDARASRDAGAYLCNYLSWRAIEATRRDGGPRLAAFVHIPLLARDGATKPGRIGLEELVDAGEAMLAELAKLTRSVVREAASA
jgi:pyroglutamyl-peptidase